MSQFNELPRVRFHRHIGIVGEFLGLSAGLGLGVAGLAIIALGATGLRPGPQPAAVALGSSAGS